MLFDQLPHQRLLLEYPENSMPLFPFPNVPVRLGSSLYTDNGAVYQYVVHPTFNHPVPLDEY
jgi:hypothetical protein